MALNFYFLKNTEIFKFNFLESLPWNFSEIFRDRRGDDCLSICKFFGKSLFRILVTESSKFFPKIWLGGPSLPGVTKILLSGRGNQ